MSHPLGIQSLHRWQALCTTLIGNITGRLPRQSAPDACSSTATNIRPAISIDIGKAYGSIVDELVPVTGIRKMTAAESTIFEAVPGGQPTPDSVVSAAADVRPAISVDVRQHDRSSVLRLIPKVGISELRCLQCGYGGNPACSGQSAPDACSSTAAARPSPLTSPSRSDP